MSHSTSVAIVLVNWNGYEDTAVCLESLKNLDYSNYLVIIVDNGSVDGSEEKLRKNYPQHTILQSSANLGFAGGCNLGIRRALQEHCDYVLLLNNDTRTEPNLITELVKTASSNDSIGITSGKVYFEHPPDRIWCYGGSFNVNTGSARHFLNEQQAAQPLKEPIYLYLPACLWLLKKECIESAGFLSEKFFHLAEDVEYCVRIQQKGWKLALTPKAVIYHKGSSSMKHLSPVYHYYEQRNRLYIVQEYRLKNRFFLLQVQDLCVIATRLCLSIFLAQSLSGFFQNAVFITRALCDFFSGRMGRRF